MKSQLHKQKTVSDMTGALNAYGSLSKSPLISSMKTHTGYQFSKSGLNSRSSVPMKVAGPSALAFGNVAQQPADRGKFANEQHSRRDSITAKNTNRVLFEKHMKTSVSQVKHPLEGQFQSDPRTLRPSISQDNIMTFKSKLKVNKTEKKEQSSTLTAALENVQRLNEEIRHQSNELKKSTSFAMLEH